ncbi:MAG TPA: outer membrane lipoprotein carrier protein LolA [Holophagaceae bacterium]|nr:outer membrane lipoprotein carrier protein LolA [Holophagaceae bacterium]
MRAAVTLVVGLFAAAPLAAQSLPGWWHPMLDAPRFESRFIQTSESQVFGKLVKKGRIEAAQGGRLRVSYEEGLLLVADGADLIQYDPDTRTAQRMDLGQALLDTPLLNLLVAPQRLAKTYKVETVSSDTVRLVPAQKDLPAMEVQGSGRFARVLRWTDASGAKQELRLLDPKVPALFKADRFKFTLPKGATMVGN